ncbi:MAG: 5-methyltetrahydropteroyltriglutamate--homocysteine S-methyltransferase [Candidatus Marinimicrobia bacterium]|nr:5-methyltetrahydropteroyltriglutamate--homocysteine S-methyltransferase [Candidatus Neomarinimicrobiota bacterium]MCF7827366.1 5-methyltetrahydropteroyltriglutamate--homocysteine S-methyltransferase [Candidatus Neomarinimicrobiota bacterium]MCF7881401.1 5-methyltetrahydropteroyltriglutamate--homocysteine S-methyltransferase [Candidatus Neomarinimicrobiota bacterium]
MAIASNLGYPRIGANRELKRALEGYWRGNTSGADLRKVASDLRTQHWQMQQMAGIDHIPSNDQSLYDHVLDTVAMVGAVPDRYDWDDGTVDLDTYFAMARGVQDEDKDVSAMEMTKWFDTNYHYIVPEFKRNQNFQLSSTKVVKEYLEAKDLGIETRPVILGPVSFLLLGKTQNKEFNQLELLDDLLPVYTYILNRLEEKGAEWVQIDEPCLVTDLNEEALKSFHKSYTALDAATTDLNILLATYFGSMEENMETAFALPVDAVHLDLTRGLNQLEKALTRIPDPMSLSLGLIDGRNVWKADLSEQLDIAKNAVERLGKERIMIGPSSSLLYVPVDLEQETALDEELASWLAFAKQKLQEIDVLATAINDGEQAVEEALETNRQAIISRNQSDRIHRPTVKERVESVTPEMYQRNSEFAERRKQQREHLNLPDLPTTSIGSLPQTKDVRKMRAAFKRDEISKEEYESFLKEQIKEAIRFQEGIGMDVLVHGEFERSDMVEFFGEQMEGVAITSNSWVQSYGSRCVRPPIIYGDISRPEPMTVKWSEYAQSLTEKPVKGMVTGPVTILQWSFVRNDQPRWKTCNQIALAIRDEVNDLENAGIEIIQIDEPALREGLPLRQSDWEKYLDWSVDAFKLASSGVKDTTQIHTHMCYSEFNDIMEAIARMDADVLSVESSRSRMELLDVFKDFDYPNEIGPGVYDIHSPRIPETEEVSELIRKGLNVLSKDQIWINPDCGLKTRNWDEIKPSLEHLVEAADTVREELQNGEGP